MNKIKQLFWYKISVRRNISLGNIHFQLQYLLEYWFLGGNKGKTFLNNRISYGNSKRGLVGSNWLLIIAINTKNKWTIWHISSGISSCYILCRAEGWHFRYIRVIWWSDTFGNAVFLVDSMAEDDLSCKFEMDALMFSEYSWRTPFLACLCCWSSWYIFIWDFSLET